MPVYATSVASLTRRSIHEAKVPITFGPRPGTAALHAQPGPTLQFRLAWIHVSPHALPVVQTRQQVLVGGTAGGGGGGGGAVAPKTGRASVPEARVQMKTASKLVVTML